MGRLLSDFCNWLEATALSQAIANAGWVVPTVQTIHILAIAVVMASALMINLRLLGIRWRDQPLDWVSARFLPYVWWPLLILLLTGVVMIIGEPARALRNPVFQLKMGLLLAAMVVTFVFQRLAGNPEFGDRLRPPQPAARLVAAVSLLLWIGIIFAGRWIAYWA